MRPFDRAQDGGLAGAGIADEEAQEVAASQQFFRGMPFIFQAVIGLLVLPVVLGLWIWESSWPLWLRLILVLGLGWATIYTFFPKQA